jgi:hypothetical protein
MFTKVQFIINQNGEVFNFKADFYNDINLQQKTNKKINNVLQSVNHSIAGIDNYFTSKGIDKFQSEIEPKQIIIPIYKDNTLSYHLVYQVNTMNESGTRLYETYVDAHSGNIVWQKACFMNYEAKVKVSLKTSDKYNFKEEKIFPFSNGYIKSQYKEGRFILDENGEVTITNPMFDGDTIEFKNAYFVPNWRNLFISDIATVSFGDPFNAHEIYPQHWGSMKPYAITDGQIDILLDGNDSIFVFTDNGPRGYYASTKYPIFGIHHIKVAYNKILEIDPKLTSCLSKTWEDGNNPLEKFRFNVTYDVSGEPNAYWNGMNAICFTDFLNDTVTLSTCPSVMYHEFGHAINTLFYKERKTDFYNRT